MKDFFPVLKILLRFVLIYIVFVLLYQFYLNLYEEDVIDPFSRWTAVLVAKFQDFLGYPTTLVDSLKQHSIYFYTSIKYTTRMVEGCNAISVGILFTAFIFAFYKGKKTFLFVSLGLVALFLINIVRIACLNIIYLQYPEYQKASHDYLFPAVIYGGVIILWIIWIQFYALPKPKENA